MRLIVLTIFLLSPLALQTPKTVLDGVYTVEQAGKGDTEFHNTCVKCHEGDDAGGPLLTGRSFIDRWREDNLDVLFEYIRTRMPADARGSLSDAAYLNVLAYLLEANGYPTGSSELTAAAMPAIRVVGKDGAKPLPNNTLVRSVGCLTQSPEGWNLTSAVEPVRSREGTETTPEELKKSQETSLGSQTFRLLNLTRIGADFNPEQYKGHRVQVKGVLLRQTNVDDRISLTAFSTLAPSCAK
jgi:S-disulfanyl-L-cysteine oxidoreductase SoxD